MTEAEIRQIIKDTGLRLTESKLVQGTWGNISVRIDDKYMMVTPSGIDYARLTPDDMIVVNIETMEYNGALKPTSERKIHAAVYRSRKDINAVIHSHPVYCSSVAAAGLDLPVMSPEMEKLTGGAVRVSLYGLPSTQKLNNETVRALKGRNACLMANHGIMACGTSIENAFETCRILEESCKLFIERETMKLTKKDTFAVNDLITVFRSLTHKNIG